MSEKHQVSDFERAVRRGAIINRMQWIFRRKALGLPINLPARARMARAFLHRKK